MKKIIFITFVLFALCAQGAVKVKCQHFEISDTVRLFDKDEPNGNGYRLTKTVKADWPVAFNGKKCESLNNYLLEKLFNVSCYRDDFPYCPDDMNVMVGFLRNVVKRKNHEQSAEEQFVIKDADAPGVPAFDCDEELMNCWYEMSEIKYSHSVGNLAFFTCYFENYLGGVHGMYFTEYIPFDVFLDKPICLNDIINNPSKLLSLLPNYDKRSEDEKGAWQELIIEELENFYIKKGKMVFSFAPYSIGSFAEGQMEIKVPLKDLKAKGLLTTYGLTLK